MGMEYDFEQIKDAKVAIIGVGGGGNNAVNRIIEDTVDDESMSDVLFVAMNTDLHVLDNSKATVRLPLGEKRTQGRGAGAKPEVGELAADDTKDEIVKILKDVDMVFITAGMGGGTGTGAAPVIAKLAKEMKILTIGVVTKPFAFEGRKKLQVAETGIEKLKANVDSLVVIPNDNVLKLFRDKGTMRDAFKRVDGVLSNSVKGICDIIKKRGEVNIDFADIKTVMTDRGIVHMGVGYGKGANRFKDALDAAIKNPLLETSIKYAKEVILNFYGDNIDVFQMTECSEYIAKEVDPEAEIIWGYREPEANCEDSDFVEVTIIAAQFMTPAGAQDIEGQATGFGADPWANFGANFN